MATPVAVPLVRSSNLDCSQVRVPSARTDGARRASVSIERRRRTKMEWGILRELCNVCTSIQNHPETQGRGRVVRPTTRFQVNTQALPGVHGDGLGVWEPVSRCGKEKSMNHEGTKYHEEVL